MKNRRQELIDFGNWLFEKEYYDINKDSREWIVEEYLKSINSAPDEACSINDHEQAKEVCGLCNGIFNTDTRTCNNKFCKNHVR